MTRRQTKRARRRTEAVLDEAFAALDRGERDLARRLSLRARASGAMNPRVLFDHADLMLEIGDRDEAEDALRAAIAIAPNHADAFAALASLQASQAKWAAAVRLMAHAVELRPDAARAVLLAEWRGKAPAGGEGADVPQDVVVAAPSPAVTSTSVVDPWQLRVRCETLATPALADELVQRGHGVVRRLLTADECATLRATCAVPDGDGLDRFVPALADGTGRARHFLFPRPPRLAQLRAALFAPAAALADALRQRLHERPCFPRLMAQWALANKGRADCRWVELPADGVTATARTDDRRAFPLRVMVDLGPDDVQTEALVIEDQRPGKKVRQSRARTRVGDVAFFVCRQRLDAVGGVYGLQIVRYALGPVPSPRQLLDLSFDGL